MNLSDSDKNKVILRYSERLKLHGYSPKTLGWEKGKQGIRFKILTSQYNFENKTVLDIGCGFGDLNKTLSEKYGNSYSYCGFDIVEDLIKIGKEKYNGENIRFIVDDFLNAELEKNSFDFAIASGSFNFKLDDNHNYEYITSVIEKAMYVSKDGLAFDFLSDKVDYQYDHTFHSSPEKILEIAYKFSRNIIFRNDYMPFEFSLFIFKDDSFSENDTIFNKYKNDKQI
jgi:SAM-dependent methyltransferase